MTQPGFIVPDCVLKLRQEYWECEARLNVVADQSLITEEQEVECWKLETRMHEILQLLGLDIHNHL